jgi:hypothetical protein
MQSLPPDTPNARRSHIIIAGTGRAGTTFLVQYLAELGLDTHVSRQGLEQLDANANAGLEDMPLVAAAETLPYVIKAPWIGEYVDEILASPDIRIDAAILPSSPCIWPSRLSAGRTKRRPRWQSSRIEPMVGRWPNQQAKSRSHLNPSNSGLSGTWWALTQAGSRSTSRDLRLRPTRSTGSRPSPPIG